MPPRQTNVNLNYFKEAVCYFLKPSAKILTLTSFYHLIFLADHTNLDRNYDWQSDFTLLAILLVLDGR